jgi:hypothetical protein
MPDGQRTTFELTAAAVSTLNAAGTYRSDKLDLALGYMRREMARHEKPTLACQNYYFYGNLYAAQAMFQAGGADWASWWKGAQEDLVAKAQRGQTARFSGPRRIPSRAPPTPRRARVSSSRSPCATSRSSSAKSGGVAPRNGADQGAFRDPPIARIRAARKG